MTSISGSSTVNYADMYKQSQQEKFLATDTDDDGKLSLGEFEAGSPSETSGSSSKASEVFSEIDTDSDGYLTEDEMASAGPPPGGPPPGGPPPGGPPGGGGMTSDTMLSLFESVSEDTDETEDTSVTSLFSVDETEEEDDLLSLLSASETESSSDTEDEDDGITSLISDQIEQFRSAATAYQNSTDLLSLIGDSSAVSA